MTDLNDLIYDGPGGEPLTDRSGHPLALLAERIEALEKQNAELERKFNATNQILSKNISHVGDLLAVVDKLIERAEEQERLWEGHGPDHD